MEGNIIQEAEHFFDSSKKSKKNYWKIAAFVFIGLFIISIISNGFPFIGESVKDIGEKKITDKFEKFLKSDLEGVEIDITDVEKESGLYRFNVNLKKDEQKQEIISYATLDGALLFPYSIPFEEPTEIRETTTTTLKDLPKTDKPKVDLFVMSHCPYGTQIEKGIIPVLSTLGNKIDFNLRFVYYAMHGKKELDQELVQYCIQKEQNTKLIKYLNCFLKDESKTEQCLTEASIDQTKLESCVASTDKQFKVIDGFNDKSTWLSGNFPTFNVDKTLNDQYEVQGSPTLVINGVNANSGRDSASLLKVICSAFKEAPKECEMVLSSAAPSPGFGSASGSNSATGSCS